RAAVAGERSQHIRVLRPLLAIERGKPRGSIAGILRVRRDEGEGERGRLVHVGLAVRFRGCQPVACRCESAKCGAPGRTRTRDPLITNQVLYQLSYKGMASTR